MVKTYLRGLILGALLFASAGVQAQSLSLAWSTDEVLPVCESALYDAENKVIYVSNIIGKPDKKDGIGTIARVSPTGQVVDTAWVRGLHAPKGMALSKGRLYVSDVDVLVIIEIATGKVLDRVSMPGALFLNDVAHLPATDELLITDSNRKLVYKYTPVSGKITTLLEGESLVKPNGVEATADGFVLVDMGSGVLYSAKANGKKLTPVATALNGGDGIVPLGKDEYLVSCWSGEIWHVKGKTTKRLLDTKEQKINAADIGFIPELNLVLVPTFFHNRLMAYKLVR